MKKFPDFRFGAIGIFAAFAVPYFVFAADSPAVEAALRRNEQLRAENARIVQEILSAERRVMEAEYAARLEAAKKNFKVTAPTQEIADKVCETAAVQWIQSKYDGATLSVPCKIKVKVGQVGAGGATTFSFANGNVFGFDMAVQGSLDRICDSVVPHEVCHIFNALDARRPLPRWLDEGVSSLGEEYTERRRQWKLAEEVVGTKRAIPIGELLRITEYPKNMSHVLTLYAEGTVLSEFLITRASAASGGQWTQEEARQWMIALEKAAHERGWDAALYEKSKELGGVSNVAQLSNEFEKWMKSGKAMIYSFKDPNLSKTGLLPVKYDMEAGKRVVPAN